MKEIKHLLTLLIMISAFSVQSFSQNNLAAGDLAIASYQSDFDPTNPLVGDNNLAEFEDRFSLIITKPGGIAAGTVIFFTTRGWNGPANTWHDEDFTPFTFGLGRRAVVRWTVPAGGIGQGTEVFFINKFHDEVAVGSEYYDWGAYSDYNGTTALGLMANVTPIVPGANTTDGMSFAVSGDKLLVYQTGPTSGPNAGPNSTTIRFITALLANLNGTTTTNGTTSYANWDAVPGAMATNESSVPPGLVNGQTCFLMSPTILPAFSNGTNEPDNGKFSACSLSSAGACSALEMSAIIYATNPTGPAPTTPNWTYSNNVFPIGTSSSLCSYNFSSANTITLTSAAGTNAQTVCINSPITNITYSTTSATGATFSGLPAGVTGSWAANVVTITGSPTTSVGSPFSYTVTLTGGCGTFTATGSITVTPNNTITLSSAAGTNAQTVCINTSITNITYSTARATGATFSGLPSGVTGSWAANIVTISGSPSTTIGSPFGYTVTLTGGCGTITATGTITVNPLNTISLTSAPGTNNQTVLVNTPIANITYATASATGATFGGLPAGVTGSWSGNVATIMGSPTTAIGSPFNYTVTLTGGCGAISATGAITVTTCTAINQTVTASPTAICSGESSTVTVGASQNGVNYTLRVDPANTLVAGPTASNGPAINFGTGPITVTTTYNVLAETDKYSINLNGGQSGFLIPANANLNVTNNFTVEGWIKPAGNGGFARMFNKEGCFALGLSSNQTQLDFVRHGSGDFTLPYTFVNGTWYHIAATYSGGNVELFVNGNSIGIIAGVPAISGANSQSYIGSDAGGNFNQFNGNIDNVRIWNNVRTQAEIAANQTAFLSSTGNPTLAASWWIIEGAGNAKDYSANAINATGLAGTWQVDSPVAPCSIVLTTKPTVNITPANTITLSSAGGTNAQTVCLNSAITNITYSTTGATGATFSGLPAGVSGSWAANVVTINGTPTTTVGSPFSYTVTLTGGCGTITATGSITVNPSNTITLTSAPSTNTQTVCINTSITNITYSTTGATGATFGGLPAGVSGSWSANVVTISGSPTTTVGSPFSYTVTLTGGCGVITATGTISVNPNNTITLSSASGTNVQSVCLNTPITNITYSTTGATGATFSGLPAGVSGSWVANVVTISGTPNTTTGSPFTYTVTLTGGCGVVTASGTITINPIPDVVQPTNQTVCNNTSTAAVNFSGAVPGTVYNWTNTAPSIGLATSGSGNIPSFSALNSGNTPITATITVTPSGSQGFAYIANSGSNTVSVINTATNTVISTIPVGTNPNGVSVSPNSTRVYITNVNSNTVSVINTATNLVVATIPVGSSPIGVAVSPDGTTVYVGNYVSNTVSVINASTNMVTGSIAVGISPGGIFPSIDGTKVYVVNFGSSSVSVINASTNAIITTIPVGLSPRNLVGSPDGTKLYVTCASSNSLYVINTVTDMVISTIPVGSGPFCVAITPDGSKVYVTQSNLSNISVINTATNTVTATINVGSYPIGISVTSDGSSVYVNNNLSNDVTVVSAASNSVIGTISVGINPYSFGNFISSGSGSPCTGPSKTFTIIVNPTPVGSASPQTICGGTASNVALSSTVTGTTYTWTAAIQTAPAGGTITGFSNCASSCGSSIAQTLTNTGTTSGVVRYTVTPTANGCPGTPFTVDVTVDVCCPTIPTLTTNPTPAVCSGNNVVLTASGLTTMNPNSYGITFKYFSAATATPYIGGTVIATVPNGSLTGGGTGATTTTNTLPVGNNFIYAILSPTPVDVNCRPSATANITVNPLPVVTTAATATICSGTATSIALTASTDPGTTFTWTIGTITGGISGASACASACGTTIAQTLTNFGSTAGSVQYLVTPVSSLGCTGAAYTITVTVNPTPNAVATPASQTICSAGTISTIVLSGSVSGTTYAWTRNNAGTVTGIAASGSGNISGALTNTTAAPITVTFTITPSANGCSGAAITATVLVNPTPNAVATPASQTICSAGTISTIVLSGAVSGTTYAWTRDNNASVTGIAASGSGNISGSLTNTTSAPITVTFTITPSANGCSGAAITATVLVNPTPNSVATPASQTICSAATISTIVLSGAVSGTTYAWTRDNTASVTGITASGSGNISGALTNTTASPITVTFTITPSANGCPGTAITATVLVNPTPNAIATTPSQTICSGPITTIALSGAVSGTVFNWTRDNMAAVPGIAASGIGNIFGSLTNTTSSPVTVTFTITPTANGCSGTPITATVVVNPTPSYTFTSNGLPYSEGDTITACNQDVLALTITSPVTVNYTFTRLSNGNVISSGTTPATFNYTANNAREGFYEIGIANSSGCILKDTIYLLVNPLPNPTATATPNPICQGGSLQLGVNGNNNFTFAWSGPNGFTSNVKNPTINGITPAGSGVYTVTVTNLNGCSNTSTISVLVNPTPTAIATPTSQTICSATSISTIVLTGAVSGTTYAWTRNNTGTVTGIAASGSGNISGTLTNTTNAPVTVTFTITPTANGCVGLPITATVLVNPKPTAVATPASQTICSGFAITTITLTGTASGTTYTWIRNNTGTVTGMAASGSGNISGLLTNTTTAPITVTFTITPSANGCVGTPITATVLVNPSPVGTISVAPNPGCVGSTVQFSATGGTTYSWSGPLGWTSTQQNPTILLTTYLQGGKYEVTITNGTGCSIVLSTRLEVFYPPIATATYETSTACTGSTLLLHGTGAGSYSWSGPNGFTSNQQNPQIPNVTAANSGLYTLIVTSPNGCSATSTINITINTPPALSANPTLTQTCEGGKIQLFATGSGSFVWTGPATYTSTDQNPVIANIPIHLSGIYTVSLTASTGCISTASVEVKVYDQIHAFASASEDTICQGQSLQLHAEGGSTYLWNGPNGFNSNESDPRIDNITPKQSGKYYVYITNEGGCFGYAELTIVVKPSAKSSAYASPNPVNENTPVQFFASSNGVAYSWSGPLGFTSNVQNPSIKKVTRYMSGVYTVTITNENGCPSIVKVILKVLYTNKGGQTIDGNEEGLSTRSEVTGTVYPNPTNDILYFDTQSAEAIEYVIYDVNGKVQVVQKTTSDRYISTSQLSSGIYQIRWKSKDSDKWIVSKFVKIR